MHLDEARARLDGFFVRAARAKKERIGACYGNMGDVTRGQAWDLKNARLLVVDIKAHNGAQAELSFAGGMPHGHPDRIACVFNPEDERVTHFKLLLQGRCGESLLVPPQDGQPGHGELLASPKDRGEEGFSGSRAL